MQQTQKETNKIFSTIFYYTILMILGPVLVFFGTKIVILEGLFGSSSVASNVWAAVTAVVALHIFLGMYIYKAYSQDTPVKPEKTD